MSDAATHPIPCIGVMIENDRGEFLLGKRKGVHGAGEWAVPGGKLDMGETIAEAALREVKEETGLDVTFESIIAVNDDLEWISDNRQYVTFIIKVLSTSGEPVCMEPHKCEELRWFALDALPDNLFNPTRRAFVHLRNNTFYTP